MSQLEPGNAPDGKQILWLKRLVTLLTITMIAGVATLVALAASLYISQGAPTWPDSLALPAGERIEALTRTERSLIAVTRDAAGTTQIHILDSTGQRIERSIALGN